jgi:hypothetical protein
MQQPSERNQGTCRHPATPYPDTVFLQGSRTFSGRPVEAPCLGTLSHDLCVRQRGFAALLARCRRGDGCRSWCDGVQLRTVCALVPRCSRGKLALYPCNIIYVTCPAETMWFESRVAIKEAIVACHFVTVCVVHVALVGMVELHLSYRP